MEFARTGLNAAIFITAVLQVGCGILGIGVTNIGSLLADPQKYAEKEVWIRGKVTNVLKIPFVSMKIYSVQDAFGEINIRTERVAPIAGSVVRVKGVLDTVAAIGDQYVGLHLREIERW